MSKTPRDEIARAIVQKLNSTQDTQTVVQEIAAYLVTEGRESELESIMRDVMAEREQDGVVEADVRVAHELSAETLAEFAEVVRAEFPAAQTVVLGQTTDSAMVGGARITTAHEQLDLSIRGKLDIFKRLTHRGNL